MKGRTASSAFASERARRYPASPRWLRDAGKTNGARFHDRTQFVDMPKMRVSVVVAIIVISGFVSLLSLNAAISWSRPPPTPTPTYEIGNTMTPAAISTARYFLRSANDAETNCNIANKQLLTTTGSSGTQVTLTNANDKACWYEQTGGLSYAAGTWMMVFDLSGGGGSGGGSKWTATVDVWDRSTHAVITTLCTKTGQGTVGNDVTYTCTGVGAQTLTANQVIRTWMQLTTAKNAVNILIEGTFPGTSDSYAEIPEFPLGAVPFAFGVAILLHRMRMRRGGSE